MQKFLSFILPEDSLRVRKILDKCSSTPDRQQHTFRIKTKDGTINHIWTEIESARSAKGTIDHVSGIVRDISESKKINEELFRVNNLLNKKIFDASRLEASLKNFDQIIATVHDAIIHLDTKGQIDYWNAAAEESYGFTAERAVGRLMSNLVIPKDRNDEISVLFKKIKAGETIRGYKTQRVISSGKVIDVVLNMIPLRDMSGKLVGAASIEKTVPAAKESDQSESIFKNAFLARTVGVVFFKANGAITDSNEAFTKMSGYEYDELLSQKMWDKMIAPDFIDFTKRTYEELAAKGSAMPYEKQMIRKDSSHWWGLFAPIRIDENGSEPQFVEFVIDITKNKQNEEKLRNFNAILEEQILERTKSLEENINFIERMALATPDILYVMNINTRHINFATHDIGKELGYNEEQIREMSEPFFDIMHPDDLPIMLSHLDAVKMLADGEVIEIQYRMIQADGKIRWFHDRNTVFKRDENDLPIEKMGISQDVTDKILQEKSIQRLSRSIEEVSAELQTVSSELETFASIAAQDYVDTLQNLYTNLEYVISRDAANLSNAGKANVRKAQRSIQKMKMLTEDIVSISKIRTPDGGPEQADLNQILIQLMSELSRKLDEAGAECLFQELPTISGYPYLIKLLFHHILDNSIKFRKRDEKLVITISSATVEESDGRKIKLLITDNGIGFPPERAEDAFRMFVRLHDKDYKGTGTGLAACRKIAALHGGTISAESDEQVGTTISVLFPE